jgi:3-oxoacyl-[acyl-carrier protein] reductase
VKLSGRRALITGASEGFGLAVARAFLAEGADVALCARNGQRLAESQNELQRSAPGRRVVAEQADVSQPAEVERLVHRAVAELGDLDILVCNAGVYGPKGPSHEVEWEAWSQAIHVNLMGAVLPCRAVLPTMLSRQSGKIIILSGGGATRPLPNLSAYAASKAAVVRWAETLAEEVRASNVEVNAVAPGALNTRLLDEVLEAGPERVGQSFFEQALKQKEQGGTPLERGAALCVFLASSDSDGLTGRLISAVWDPWERFAEWRDRVRDSDIYTLRRIVPADRGQDWG